MRESARILERDARRLGARSAIGAAATPPAWGLDLTIKEILTRGTAFAIFGAMESIFDLIGYLWPVAIGALVIFHSWDIRQLRRRIERLENPPEKKSSANDDFWKRYESTRPK